MKKRIVSVLLTVLVLLSGCQAAPQEHTATFTDPTDVPIADVVTLVEIVDIAQRDGLDCAEALQPFYETDDYVYSYPCIKSQYVVARFSDGTEKTAEEALKSGEITIADLDQYGITYYKEGRSPDITPSAYSLASPVLPELPDYPTEQEDWDVWSQQQQLWHQERSKLHTAPSGYADSLKAFWQASIPVFLSGKGTENAVYSPISLYMALAMLAQTTGGQSRQEILELLGADSMESLARQARYIFLNQYENDGLHTSILANSLWLDEGRPFHRQTVDLLADNFYASVYQGALESPELNIALKNWLNEQTGGLLADSIDGLEPMNEDTAFALASTIYYRCNWMHDFYAGNNTQDIFYSPAGQQTVTYMNQSDTGSYYWGENYSAVCLPLDDGSRMWLILPDEGITAQALLRDFDTEAQSKTLTINLSVPKFDVSADLDLMAGLSELGIRQAADPHLADFSAISPDPDLYLSSANQGVRVSIDEDGLTGAAYTLMLVADTAMPLEQEVDFVLNRPFLFVVESGDGLPLFTGIVNQPTETFFD